MKSVGFRSNPNTHSAGRADTTPPPWAHTRMRAHDASSASKRHVASRNNHTHSQPPAREFAQTHVYYDKSKNCTFQCVCLHHWRARPRPCGTLIGAHAGVRCVLHIVCAAVRIVKAASAPCTVRRIKRAHARTHACMHVRIGFYGWVAHTRPARDRDQLGAMQTRRSGQNGHNHILAASADICTDSCVSVT